MNKQNVNCTPEELSKELKLKLDALREQGMSDEELKKVAAGYYIDPKIAAECSNMGEVFTASEAYRSRIYKPNA